MPSLMPTLHSSSCVAPQLIRCSGTCRIALGLQPHVGRARTPLFSFSPRTTVAPLDRAQAWPDRFALRVVSFTDLHRPPDS